MRHKHLTLVLAVLMSMVASVAWANGTMPDEGESLNLFTQSSKEAVPYSLSDLRKITFTNKGVQIWVTDWPTEYSYSQFRVITLNEDNGETGINSLSASSEVANGITYYDLQGRKVGSPKRGIYIVRMADGVNRKVMVK